MTIVLLLTQAFQFYLFVKAVDKNESKEHVRYDGMGCLAILTIPADTFIAWLLIAKFL